MTSLLSGISLKYDLRCCGTVSLVSSFFRRAWWSGDQWKISVRPWGASPPFVGWLKSGSGIKIRLFVGDLIFRLVAPTSDAIMSRKTSIPGAHGAGWLSVVCLMWRCSFLRLRAGRL